MADEPTPDEDRLLTDEEKERLRRHVREQLSNFNVDTTAVEIFEWGQECSRDMRPAKTILH